MGRRGVHTNWILAHVLPVTALFVATAGQAEPAALGSYEQAALDSVLSERGLSLEPAPAGKTLGAIHVANLEVAGPDTGYFQWFNIFHRTTREYVIRREVLLRPGARWDQVVVDETRRRLADPLFTSLVVTVPVKSSKSGHVDLLIVTRDIWSLRTNFAFEYQDGQLTQLQFSLSENNLLGLRKHVALAFAMDQGAYAIGPQYIDRNLAGTRLRLETFLRAVFSRETSEREGSIAVANMTYPLWSHSQRWGAGLSLRHETGVARQYFGAGLRTYDHPDTAAEEAVPRVYRLRRQTLALGITRSFGSAVKQSVTAGYRLSADRPRLTDDFGLSLDPSMSDPDVVRAGFIRDVLPRSERISAPYVEYEVFENRFTIYRNIDTYDIVENHRLGPSLQLLLRSSREELGSEDNFVGFSAAADWKLDLRGDGYASFGAQAGGRLDGGDIYDAQFNLSARMVTPTVGFGRLVLRARGDRLIDNRNNNFLSLGGLSGLRGFDIAQFSGQARARTNVEFRSQPVRLLFARVGGVVFWDAGDAAERVRDLGFKHDVGVGLRALIPQLQLFLLRIDYAIPLNGPSKMFPGRLSGGFAKAF